MNHLLMATPRLRSFPEDNVREQKRCGTLDRKIALCHKLWNKDATMQMQGSLLLVRFPHHQITHLPLEALEQAGTNLPPTAIQVICLQLMPAGIVFHTSFHVDASTLCKPQCLRFPKDLQKAL
jgi:hypothetical protein